MIFADLVGSTEMAGDRDPERTRVLLERFYDAMADEAVPRVAVEQPERHLVERRLHGVDLGQDVDAVAVFLDHPGQASDLAFDAVEPCQHRSFGIRLHG